MRRMICYLMLSLRTWMRWMSQCCAFVSRSAFVYHSMQPMRGSSLCLKSFVVVVPVVGLVVELVVALVVVVAVSVAPAGLVAVAVVLAVVLVVAVVVGVVAEPVVEQPDALVALRQLVVEQQQPVVLAEPADVGCVSVEQSTDSTGSD